MGHNLVKKLNDNWTFKKRSDSVWLKAEVPGCVHTDLLLNNKIKDPFIGLNETELQWISDENWVYRKTISVDKNIFEMDFIFP